MRYYLLKKIVEYIQQKADFIKYIKRVDNNIIIIEFNNKNIIYFDLSKSNSTIFKSYEKILTKKDFNAPFDVVLQKRFTNSKIEKVELYNDDKIINFVVSSSNSYKKTISILQLEFTGKYTNIIVLDENRLILEALRHIDENSSSRVVKVGLKLQDLVKKDFTYKMEEVYDIEKHLFDEYKKRLFDSLENLKQLKANAVQKEILKLEDILISLPKKDDLEQESQNLYEKSNLILANLHNILPYQKELKVFNDDKEIIIELNNMKSPQNYTNELFKKARKLKQKAQNIKIEKKNLEEKIEYLKRLKNSINSANSIDECEFLYPKKEKNQTKTKKEKNYESFFFSGYKIMLGTNERENIYLLENSKSSDFWFHLKDRPSCHVIVQNSKKELPEELIKRAALLCVKFSVDFSGNYEVDYTQRRNVKIKQGANVLYNPFNTININFICN